jgi:hypothetical protein
VRYTCILGASFAEPIRKRVLRGIYKDYERIQKQRRNRP